MTALCPPGCERSGRCAASALSKGDATSGGRCGCAVRAAGAAGTSAAASSVAGKAGTAALVAAADACAALPALLLLPHGPPASLVSIICCAGRADSCGGVTGTAVSTAGLAGEAGAISSVAMAAAGEPGGLLACCRSPVTEWHGLCPELCCSAFEGPFPLAGRGPGVCSECLGLACRGGRLAASQLLLAGELSGAAAVAGGSVAASAAAAAARMSGCLSPARGGSKWDDTMP